MLARAAAVAVGGAAEVGGVRVTRRAVKLRAAPSVLPNSTRTTGHNLDIQIFFHCSNIFYLQIFSDLLCGGPGAVLLQHEGAGGRHGGGGGGTSSQSQPQWPLVWQQVGKGGLRMEGC